MDPPGNRSRTASRAFNRFSMGFTGKVFGATATCPRGMELPVLKEATSKSRISPRGQMEAALGGVEANYRAGDELPAAGFRHPFDVEADVPGSVGAGQHPGTHAGVVVVIGQADYGYPVASLNDMLQLSETGQMGMSAAPTSTRCSDIRFSSGSSKFSLRDRVEPKRKITQLALT